MQLEPMGVICGECAWEGEWEETADDGAAWPVVCPLCGSDELVYHSAVPTDGGAAS